MHSSLDAFMLYTSDMIRVVLQRGRSSVNSCRQLRRPRNSIFDAGYDELHIDVVLRCLHVTALCSESMVWEHGSVWTFVFCISARAFSSHFHRIFRRIFVASCFLMWRELHPINQQVVGGVRLSRVQQIPEVWSFYSTLLLYTVTVACFTVDPLAHRYTITLLYSTGSYTVRHSILYCTYCTVLYCRACI